MKDTTLGFLFVGMLLIGAAADKATQPAATPTELKDAAIVIQRTMDQLNDPRLGTNPPCGGKPSLSIGHYSIAIGICAGWEGMGRNDILIGICTRLPTPTTNDFVNIGNKLCFWRTTGERADCPPLVPECGKDK